MSELEVLKAFESHNTQKKEPAKLQSFSRRVAHQANDDKLMMVSYFILAAVLALVVIWWFQQSDNEALTTIPEIDDSGYQIPQDIQQQASVAIESIPPQSNGSITGVLNNSLSEIPQAPTAVGEQEAMNSASLAPDSSAIEDSEQRDTALDEEGVSILGQEPQATLNEQDLAEPETLILPDPVELVFEFAGDCWMNLTDATGEDVAYGVKVAGRVMTVSGVPPFAVTLGAPEVVQISYMGVAVDMTRFRAGYTAKFTLPLTE